jgi:hypothetical protein
VTFVAPKLGFAAPAARAVLGEVRVAPIGAPRGLVERMLARQPGANAGPRGA